MDSNFIYSIIFYGGGAFAILDLGLNLTRKSIGQRTQLIQRGSWRPNGYFYNFSASDSLDRFANRILCMEGIQIAG